MSGEYGTPFAETEALVAVMEDDIIDAKKILRGFFPGELAGLERQCERLARLCRVVLTEMER